jgi:hypothetical protein
MNSNRRNFIKKSAIGAGFIASGLSACTFNENGKLSREAGSKHSQKFNMCGYSAPKLQKVRIGFIGLGSRGTGAVTRISHIGGVEIVALCDVYEFSI